MRNFNAIIMHRANSPLVLERPKYVTGVNSVGGSIRTMTTENKGDHYFWGERVRTAINGLSTERQNLFHTLTNFLRSQGAGTWGGNQ